MNKIVEKWEDLEREGATWVNIHEEYKEKLDEIVDSEELQLDDKWVLIDPFNQELRTFDPKNEIEEVYDIGFYCDFSLVNEVYESKQDNLLREQINKLEDEIERCDLEKVGYIDNFNDFLEDSDRVEVSEIIDGVYSSQGELEEERALSLRVEPDSVELTYSKDYTGDIPDLGSINGLEKV